MHKVTAAILLAFSSVCHADSSLLVGDWKCVYEVKSALVPITQKEALSIKADATYELVKNVYGTDLADIGKWTLHGNKLTLQGEAYISKGKTSPSNHSSTHTVITLEGNKLLFTREPGMSTCTK